MRPKWTSISRNIAVVTVTTVILLMFHAIGAGNLFGELESRFLVPLCLGVVGRFGMTGPVVVRFLSLNSVPLLVGLYFFSDTIAPGADAEASGLLLFYIGYWIVSGSVTYFVLHYVAKLLVLVKESN